MHVTTRTGSLQVQFTKKGTALVHSGKAQAVPQEPNLAHDRHKRLVLSADAPDPFLYAVGIMTKDGKVRAEQQRKFRQINEFLKIVDQTVSHAMRAGLDLAQVDAVDCGCGNAYLTFATYHYSTHVRHVPTQMVGIDVNAEPLTRHVATARLLGWEHLTFHTGRIITYEPPRAPTLLLSLHACDTATDEALAQAIKRTGGGMVSSSTAATPRAKAHTSGGTDTYDPDRGACPSGTAAGVAALSVVVVLLSYSSPTATSVMSCSIGILSSHRREFTGRYARCPHYRRAGVPRGACPGARAGPGARRALVLCRIDLCP